jgi:hypothetical protein
LDDQVALGFCWRKQIDVPSCRSGVRVERWQSGNPFRQLARRLLEVESHGGSLFAWRWSDNNVDAGTIGLSINCFLAYQVQRSFKPFHPFIPVVPWPIRESQAGVQQLLHDASDLDSITYLILLQEMIFDHFTQMFFCETNRHRASL